MKRLQKHQILFAGIFALAVTFIASNSFAALNAYLKLKGQKQSKTYLAKPDAEGKFTFTNVEPDVYTLTFEVRATDAAGNTGSDASIEISSFSWGVSNSGSMAGSSGASGKQGKSTPVVRSNVSNNRTWTVDTQGPVVTISGVTVATADVDGDGFADKISSPVSISLKDAMSNDGTVSKVVFQNLTVMAACSPEGKVSMKGWDLKNGTK